MFVDCTIGFSLGGVFFNSVVIVYDFFCLPVLGFYGGCWR